MKVAHKIVKHVLLTEKGTRLADEENKYLFMVDCGANKLEIKGAVEDLFDVRVKSVNTLNRKGKKKRLRMQTYGTTAASKKAIVTLQDGDEIDLL